MNMTNVNDRVELNKTLNFVKKLILNGYSDDSFGWIQQHMSNVRPFVDPYLYNLLGEQVRNTYTDSVDVKELNKIVKEMKVDENYVVAD